MLQYTKGTLKTALTSWNTNSDPDYVATLDEIIRRGELIVVRALDIENMDSVNDTTTSATVPQVWKPINMIYERVVVISVAGVTKQLRKRSRAWIELYNQDATNGEPKYYSEFDEQRWQMAPIPNNAYLVTVHGQYLLESLADGSDGATTWMSTNIPDILFYACSIAACDFLKHYAKKADNESNFGKLARDFVNNAKTLRRTEHADTAPSAPGQ